MNKRRVPGAAEPQLTRRHFFSSEVAAQLGITVPTVLRWREGGRFPGARRVGHRWYFPATDVERLLAG